MTRFNSPANPSSSNWATPTWLRDSGQAGVDQLTLRLNVDTTLMPDSTLPRVMLRAWHQALGVVAILGVRLLRWRQRNPRREYTQSHSISNSAIATSLSSRTSHAVTFGSAPLRPGGK